MKHLLKLPLKKLQLNNQSITGNFGLWRTMPAY
jgi:hypothetical protein